MQSEKRMPRRAYQVFLDERGGRLHGARLLLQNAPDLGDGLGAIIENVEALIEIETHEARFRRQTQGSVAPFTARNPVARLHHLNHEHAGTDGVRRSRWHYEAVARPH